MSEEKAGVRTYIDWNGDGDTNDLLEQSTSRTRVDREFRGQRGRDQARMLAPPMAGSSAMVLDNESKDYSPENTASPIYANLVPGRSVQHEAILWNTDYAEQVLADNPIAYWRLGDFNGLARDWTNRGHEGTYQGTAFASTPAIGGGKNGSAFLNGTTGYIAIPAAPDLDLTGACTVEAWCKTLQVTGQRTLVGGWDDASPNAGWGLAVGNGGNGRAAMKIPGAGAFLNATTPLVFDGAWHHLVGTLDGVTARLYVDGAEVANVAAGAHASYTGVRALGRIANAAAEFFNGSVDEVAIYNTALAPSRVAAHYLAGRPSTYRAEVMADAPSVYWRFGAVTGTTSPDVSGNGRHGTIAGTPAPTLGVEGALFQDPDTAWEFPGGTTNARVEIADAAWQDLTTFSVECWFNLTGTFDPTKDLVIYAKEHAGGAIGVFRNYGLFFRPVASGGGIGTSLCFYFTTGGSVSNNGLPSITSLPTPLAIQPNRWYHTVAVVDDTTKLAALYVNGDLIYQSSAPYTGSPDASTGPLSVGGPAVTIFPSYVAFPGRIDEFAIYPTALSGARIWAHYKAGVRGRHGLSTNILDDLPQQPEWAEKTATIPALGSLSFLRSQTVSTALYTNITTNEAMHRLLDAAGWPRWRRRVHIGATTLLYWWLKDQSPYEAALTILRTEGPGAALYENEWGDIVFEGRQYRLSHPRSTTVQTTFGAAFAPPYRLENLQYNPGLKNIVNRCSMSVNRRAASGTVVLWTLGASLTLGPSEVKLFYISAADPINSTIAPAAGTDYTVSSGSLTAITASGTGGVATLSITAGAGGAVLSGLQLRGTTLTLAGTIGVKNNADATASIAKYGAQDLPYDIWPEIDYLVAQDFCDAIVNSYKDPRPTVQIRTVASVGGVTGREALAQHISDRIGIQDSQLAMNMEAMVEQVSYEIQGSQLFMQYGCEKAATGTYAVWGTAQWDLSRWAF